MTLSEVQPGEGQSGLRGTIAALEDELVAFRRDLHAHPELLHAETRTTARIAARLTAAGVRLRLLAGTGLVADIGPLLEEVTHAVVSPYGVSAVAIGASLMTGAAMANLPDCGNGAR